MRTSLLLVGFFICLYTITLNAVFRVDDEHILAARTQSLVLWGEFAETQVYGNQRVQALIPLGDPATQIEPGQAFLGAAFIKTANALRLGSAQALFSLNLYLTAISVGLVYFIVRFFDYSRRVGMWCAVFFGAGSIIWPYAMTYYRDTLAMVMSGLVFLGWTLAKRTEGRRRIGVYLLISGGLFGGILAKNSALALLPILAFALLVENMRTPLVGRKVWRGLGIALVLLLTLFMLLIMMPEEGPWARFSLRYYRDLAVHFVGSLGPNLLAALLGPFISPAKSIFLFSPPLLFVIVGLRKNLDSRPVYTFMAVSYAFLLVLAQGLFYRERWSGTFGWGLRSILPALPGLFPLMAPTIDGLISGYSPTRKVLLWGMLILSVVIQVSGAIVPWHQIFLDWQAQGLDAFGANAAWKIRFLSIPHHILRLAKPQEWSMVWSRLLQAGEYGSLLIPTLSLMLGVVLLRRIIKPVRAIGRGRFLILILSAFIIPSAPTWWAVSPDPAWGGDRSEFQSALNAVEQEVKEQDVVIIDSYGTPLWVFWMNRWRQPAHWFSTPFELPAFNGEMETLSPITEGVLLEIVARGEEGSTVWYVRTNETPDFGTHMKRQWLERRYDLKYCVYFTRTAIVEVCAFRLKERIGSIHKPAIVLD